MSFIVKNLKTGSKIGKLISEFMPEDFLDNPESEFLAAFTETGEISGMLCYELNDYFAEILFVHVIPRYRNQGVARALIGTLVEAVEESGDYSFVHAVWSGKEEEAFGKIIRSFNGFHIQEIPSFYRLSPKDRQSSQEYQKLMDIKVPKAGIERYCELSPRIKNAFLKDLSDRGYGSFVDFNGDYLEDLSLCFIKEDRIESAILFKKSEDNVINLSFIWMDSGQQKILGLTTAEASQIFESNYGDSYLEFTVTSDKAANLAEKLFKDAKPQSIFSGIKFV